MRFSAVLVFGLLLSTTALAGRFDDGMDAFHHKDYSSTLCFMQPLAEQGNAEAQNFLGEMYDRAWGVEENNALALKWYRMAADQGLPEAEKNLGLMYEFGKGVSKDISEAMKLYRSAADQGNATAQSFLGNFYSGERSFTGPQPKEDFSEAYFWFSLATKSEIEKQFSDSDARKRDEVAKHLSPAQKAAADKRVKEWKAKTSVAEVTYPEIYLYHAPRPKTPPTAEQIKLFEKAKQGDQNAQIDLALAYIQGQGVVQNYNIAMEYLRKAALTETPHPDYVPDKQAAVKIGEAALEAAYGQKRGDALKPLSANLQGDDTWLVEGREADKKGVGGGTGVWINKHDGTILGITPMK